MDGWRLLTSRDPAERLALIAVTVKAREARDRMDPWTAQPDDGTGG